jgi:hypothetical protein
MSEQTEYVYDVFISYSQTDQPWVLNELLPMRSLIPIYQELMAGKRSHRTWKVSRFDNEKLGI